MGVNAPGYPIMCFCHFTTFYSLRVNASKLASLLKLVAADLPATAGPLNDAVVQTMSPTCIPTIMVPQLREDRSLPLKYLGALDGRSFGEDCCLGDL